MRTQTTEIGTSNIIETECEGGKLVIVVPHGHIEL